MNPYFEHVHIPNLGLPNINPIMGGVQQCSPLYTFGPAIRQYYIVFHVMNGRGTYTVNGTTYFVHAGQGFVIRLYEAHLLQADEKDPWEHLWIGFETTLTMPKLLSQQYVFDVGEYKSWFLQIYEIHRRVGAPVAYSVAIYALLEHMHAFEEHKKNSTDIVDRAIDIIKSEYSSVTVQSLADRLFVNRSYFGVKFKARTGKTPKAYIDEVRLSIATKLIHEFGYTVMQAASATGYNDRTVFSKMYKKHYGVSPRSSTQSKKGRTIVLN